MVKIKPNIVDNQRAFEYVVYMMFGSYFDKTVLRNVLQEKNMYVQYMEQKEKSQFQMEDICIRFIERKLMKELPEELWTQQVEVKIGWEKSSGALEINAPLDMAPGEKALVTLTCAPTKENTAESKLLIDEFRFVIDGTPSEMLFRTSAVVKEETKKVKE